MLIATAILLLTFASLGFLITKKNARYMLSGFKQFHHSREFLFLLVISVNLVNTNLNKR